MEDEYGRKLYNPFVQHDDDGKVVPTYQLGDVNDRDQTIITRNTPGAILQNKLFTRISGWDLYTDIDDTIIIDRHGANIFILRNAIEDDISPANEREYLLLLVGLEGTEEEFEDTFRGVIGRQNVFETVLSIVDVIDLHKSKILAETTKLKGAISLFQFMKMCVDKDLVDNPWRFDPYDYDDANYDDIIEED